MVESDTAHKSHPEKNVASHWRETTCINQRPRKPSIASSIYIEGPQYGGYRMLFATRDGEAVVVECSRKTFSSKKFSSGQLRILRNRMLSDLRGIGYSTETISNALGMNHTQVKSRIAADKEHSQFKADQGAN